MGLAVKLKAARSPDEGRRPESGNRRGKKPPDSAVLHPGYASASAQRCQRRQHFVCAHFAHIL